MYVGTIGMLCTLLEPVQKMISLMSKLLFFEVGFNHFSKGFIDK